MILPFLSLNMRSSLWEELCLGPIECVYSAFYLFSVVYLSTPMTLATYLVDRNGQRAELKIWVLPKASESTPSPPCPSSQLSSLRSFPHTQQALYNPLPTSQLSPPPPNQRTTSASAPALWSSGFGRRVAIGGGFPATEMPGFDSRAAKQNLPQESQEGFRNRIPTSSRPARGVGR